MFSITDNERLRDAYALLMFMQSDIPASAEKRAAVKNLAATVKMEIRAYNNRPAPDVHIICADYDGWSLFSCPMNWTRRSRRMPPTGFATTAIWKLTTALTTAQGRSSRTDTSYSGGAATGSHTIRLVEMFKEKVQ